MKKLIVIVSIVFLVLIIGGVFFLNNTNKDINDDLDIIDSNDQEIICTREYDPVCGVDEVTYPNECMAGDTEIAYSGECEKNNSKDNYDQSDLEITDKQQECEGDTDCVPVPGCHPKECINKDYIHLFEKPEICTMEYDLNAPYEDTDCLCVNKKCTNKNL